jgi:4-alpha-glucanotransferase
LKERQNDRPWYEWPAPLKNRDQKALARHREQLSAEIAREKMLQFLFHRQWQALKAYCRDREIRIFGDLPFYISYDSADVWSHPQYFSLDEEKNPVGLAGVPPDYFNESGQLWGMPVYRWGELKKNGYDWWIRRIRKNLEFFDLLRLDHFHAFADYWEVPAGEKSAIKGEWRPGPGHDFFVALQKSIGELPLIAEDLGDISPEVYQLRDDFDLPGMMVLQFAFGPGLPRSVHAPHNYRPNGIAYTGTHDNNTTKGWFESDLDADGRARLNAYAGATVTVANASRELMRLAFRSGARTAIAPMQDVLNCGAEARMNTPSTVGGNWRWRLKTGQADEEAGKALRGMTELYGRY